MTIEQALAHLRDGYPKITTRAQYCSHVRAALRQRGWSDEQMGTLHLSKQEYEQLGKLQVARLKDASSDIIRVKAAPMLRGARKIIASATDPGTSVDHVVTALGIVTGRRMAELLVTARFEVVDDNHVMFKGQLKTPDADPPAYKIRILAPADQVVRALRVVRDAYPSMTLEGANGAPQQRLSKIVKRIDKNISFHTLRTIYASILYEAARPTTMMSINAFMAAALGHSNIATSVSYTKLRVVDMADTLKLV